MTTKKSPAKKVIAKKKPVAKKVEAVEEPAATVETGEEVETEAATESVVAPKKKRAVKKELTEKQQAAVDKRKEKEKVAKDKEKSSRELVAQVDAIKAIEANVDPAIIKAGKVAANRITKNTQTMRADWISIGITLSEGKKFCLKEDDTVNQVIFGAWIKKIGLDIIAKSKRADVIWLGEFYAQMEQHLPEEAMSLIENQNNPQHIRSAARKLGVDLCDDETREAIGLGARVPEVKKEPKPFDVDKFIVTMANGITENFEYDTEDFDRMFSSLKAAVKVLKAAAANVGETEEE